LKMAETGSTIPDWY